jgi:anti-repressor protein
MKQVQKKEDVMNEVLKINYEAEQPTVSARELHEALGISKRFSAWFEVNSKGFIAGQDFTSVLSGTVVNNGATREIQDYNISTEMAKHICLMSRTEKGMQCRQYFIDLEKAWNTPEQIMARALKMANHSIESLKGRCKFLGEQVVEQQQIITELQPKADYVDMILQSKSLVTITQIAKDYGMSGRKLNKILKELKIQYKVGGQWVLYSKYQNGGYVHSRTIDITRTDGRADVTMQTEWTQKGRLFLYEELKKHGYLPVIEQAA